MHGIVGIVGLDTNQPAVGASGDVLDVDARFAALLSVHFRGRNGPGFARVFCVGHEPRGGASTAASAIHCACAVQSCVSDARRSATA